MKASEWAANLFGVTKKKIVADPMLVRGADVFARVEKAFRPSELLPVPTRAWADPDTRWGKMHLQRVTFPVSAGAKMVVCSWGPRAAWTDGETWSWVWNQEGAPRSPSELPMFHSDADHVAIALCAIGFLSEEDAEAFNYFCRHGSYRLDQSLREKRAVEELKALGYRIDPPVEKVQS